MPSADAARVPEFNADLRGLSSFRLPARAEQLLSLHSLDQLPKLNASGLRRLVLGGGSNTVFLSDWPGMVLLNRLRGMSVTRLDADQSLVRVAAGESWHDLVLACVKQGLYGIENLVMIPGLVGAAPMQNIGAYGVELAERVEAVEVYEWASGQHQRLAAADCGFAYRDSHFRSRDRDRYLITAVQLRLDHRYQARTHYASLAEHLQQSGLGQPNPRQLMAAVMRLRRHRLPNPSRLANAGSFFHNPIVAEAQADALRHEHPNLPIWPQASGQCKLSAAWMIDQLGLRGFRMGDAGVHVHHALVLVNHGQASAEQLLALIDHIQKGVQARFGLALTPEPNLIDAARGA